MSDNPSEPKYPQRIRGGAGYFPEEGKVIIQGYYGARLELPTGETPEPSPIPASEIMLLVGPLLLVWKRAGSVDHPRLDLQNLEDARYRQIGSSLAGWDTTIEFTLELLSPTLELPINGLGSGPNGKGWYFYPVENFLKPDFNNGSVQSVGSMQIWINDGHRDLVGGCKWSKNVGSGIDGILLTYDGGHQPISENYPRTWPKGSKIRVQINYWVPPA